MQYQYEYSTGLVTHSQIAAVIASAKDAGLPDDEMETVRRAAQRAILGDYSKNTKTKELAVKHLKETLTNSEATAADKRRALDAAERQGVNSQNHYLFAEYVRQVEVAEEQEEHDRQLMLELAEGRTFSDWVHDVVEGSGVTARDFLIASVVPTVCLACLAVCRICNKPSAASLERELLAAEAKELAQKSKRGNSKAAVRLAQMPRPPRPSSFMSLTGVSSIYRRRLPRRDARPERCCLHSPRSLPGLTAVPKSGRQVLRWIINQSMHSRQSASCLMRVLFRSYRSRTRN
eukprot:COSAG02_NODE_1681_length_11351_cov_20.077320_8_plen_290_part_00